MKLLFCTAKELLPPSDCDETLVSFTPEKFPLGTLIEKKYKSRVTPLNVKCREFT